MIFIIVAIFTILAVSALYYKVPDTKIYKNGTHLKCPPNTLPLIGNGLLFLNNRNKLFSWFVKCERQFGFESFLISVPTLPPGVVINDPKNLKFVLKNNNIFAKGSFFREKSWDLFGNGIINADGDLWRVQRVAGLKFLSNENVKALSDLALPKYLKQAVEGLKLSDNIIIDMNEVFHELTTQLMGKMAYNMEMHHSDEFTIAFDFASAATAARFQNPLWQITELFTGRTFRQATSKVMEFGSLIVSNYIQASKLIDIRSSINDSFDSLSGTLMSSLMEEIKDEKVVAEAALNYLSAGKDTTAQALTWTLYLLMKNPYHMDIARDQIEQALNVNKTSCFEIQNLDTSVFKPALLPYILAVFYESLRFFPPIPFELKQCQESTILPDGTYLPKDSIICWCPWAMNRSILIWGEDAEDFKPERWLDKGVIRRKSAYEFPVFNGGPRACLGKKMAESLAVQVISTMILCFDFSLLDQRERISKNSLTLPMEGGLPCRISTRNYFAG